MNKTALFFLILVVFISNQSFAARAKVKKVKGRNAIIETSFQLEEGKTYQLTEEPISEDVDYSGSVIKSRGNSLSLGAQLSYLKTDTSDSSSVALQTRYGWNFASTEVGVLLDVSTTDQGSGSTTRLSAGGYLDYNIENNRDPKSLIYGPFALVAFGSTSYPESSLQKGTTNLEGDLGGFLTFFLGGSTTAIRTEGYFLYKQLNSSTNNVSASGFGSRVFIVYYF